MTSVLTAALVIIAGVVSTSADANDNSHIDTSHQVDTSHQEKIFFDIAPSNLSEALQSLSKQADVEIISTLPDAQFQTKELNERLTAEEALEYLLSPLSFEIFRVSNGFVVKAAPAPLEKINPINTRHEEYDFDVIVVKDFRRAIRQAREVKRSSADIQDTIVAQDIARFPDLNLAESLQRVPGVTITRERGEGVEISLRGLGPDFTRVQLNGMEVLSNTDRDRGFEFNVFASELFSQIDVKKSYTASLDEGGIGGTVQLTTPKPFDLAVEKALLAGQFGSNTNAKAFDHRFAGLITKRNEIFGALASFAYSNRTSQGQDASTFRYRARDLGVADISNLDLALQQQLNNAEIFLPRGNRYRVSTEEQRRFGATTSLQWRRDERLELNLNGVFSRYTVDRIAENIQTRGLNSFPVQGELIVDGESFSPTVVDELIINDDNEFTYGVFQNANIGTETTKQNERVTFYQLSADWKWRLSDSVTLNGLAGYSESKTTGREDKFYNELISDLILDYRGENRFNPKHQYSAGANITDVANWRAHEIDLRDLARDYSNLNTRIDGELRLNPQLSLSAGVSYKELKHDGSIATSDNLFRDEWQSGALDDSLEGLGYTVSHHYADAWVGVNPDNALQSLGVTRDAGTADPAEDYSISEETFAAFAKIKYDTELLGAPTIVSAGVRYFQNHLTSTGLVRAQNAEEETQEIVSLDRRSHEWLPTVNISSEIRKNLLLRFSYSQNVTRPPLHQLSLATNVRIDNFQDIATGNPNLRSYKSNNIDIYLEHYFGRIGFAAIGFFYKDVQNFITRASTVIPYGETGLPLSLLDSQQDAATPFTYITFVNSQDAEILGVEAAFQSDLGFIHTVVKDIGVIGNYTYADGSLDYVDLNGNMVVTAPFSGLSRHSANGTIYYETDRWGVRGTAAFRSHYITDVEVGLTDEDSRGRLGSVFVDASAFVTINDRLKLTIEGLNLTNEAEISYSDSLRRLTERRRSGATLLAGLRIQF